MADVKSVIVEPDIRFDADTTHRKRGVKRHIAPVIIVAVDGFLEAKKKGQPHQAHLPDMSIRLILCNGIIPTGTISLVRSVGYV